jgi:hypothetical protein
MQSPKPAPGAGRYTPTCETAHVASAGRIEDQQTGADCAALDADRKTFATLHRIDAAHLPTLKAVGDLLRKIGGRP